MNVVDVRKRPCHCQLCPSFRSHSSELVRSRLYMYTVRSCTFSHPASIVLLASSARGYPRPTRIDHHYSDRPTEGCFRPGQGWGEEAGRGREASVREEETLLKNNNDRVERAGPGSQPKKKTTQPLHGQQRGNVSTYSLINSRNLTSHTTYQRPYREMSLPSVCSYYQLPPSEKATTRRYTHSLLFSASSSMSPHTVNKQHARPTI